MIRSLSILMALSLPTFNSFASDHPLCPDESYFTVTGDNGVRYGWFEDSTCEFNDSVEPADEVAVTQQSVHPACPVGSVVTAVGGDGFSYGWYQEATCIFTDQSNNIESSISNSSEIQTGAEPNAMSPSYRNQIRDPGEGESFITDNVITLVSSVSDFSRQRNRLVVDTKSRLIADLSILESTTLTPGSRVLAKVTLKPYNDTVDSNITTPDTSAGDVIVDVNLDLVAGGELTISACAKRDIGDDQEELFILGGASCIFDTSPVQFGERQRLGIEFDRDTGELTIIINRSTFEYQLTGPFYETVDQFNRVEVTARDGQSTIVTEVYGIGSDNFDDDFSNGLTVEGITTEADIAEMPAETNFVQITDIASEEIFGQRLSWDENFIILNNDGTLNGTWNDSPAIGDWYMSDDGLWCRTYSEFNPSDFAGIEACHLWERSGSEIKGTREQGTGTTYFLTIEG